MFDDPIGEPVNLFADVMQRLPAVIDADIADGTYIGRSVELRYFALVVVSWKRLIAWAAVRVHNYEKVYGWVVRDPGCRN